MKSTFIDRYATGLYLNSKREMYGRLGSARKRNRSGTTLDICAPASGAIGDGFSHCAQIEFVSYSFQQVHPEFLWLSFPDNFDFRASSFLRLSGVGAKFRAFLRS